MVLLSPHFPCDFLSNPTVICNFLHSHRPIVREMSFSRRCHRITFMVKDTLGANQVGGMLSRLLFFFPYFVILTTSFPIWNLDSKQDYSIEPSIRTWTVDTLFRNDCKMSHYYSVAGRHCCLKFVCCVAFQRLCIISSLELVYMLTTCDLL